MASDILSIAMVIYKWAIDEIDAFIRMIFSEQFAVWVPHWKCTTRPDLAHASYVIYLPKARWFYLRSW